MYNVQIDCSLRGDNVNLGEVKKVVVFFVIA